jgi:cobalt-zinc-cadmium efflux system membrane fusion protein
VSAWYSYEHPTGFKDVTIGGSDEQAVEIVSGLSAGEQIAVKNTFLLKADLGKGEAGDTD